MNELQFLTWVRGPGLDIALGIFLLGVIWRLLEIYTLGRRKSLAEPRSVPGASGWHTILRRFLPPQGMTLTRSWVVFAASYAFHIGLAVTVFLFRPHILMIDSLIGISWPGLPSQLVDLMAVVSLAGMLLVLADRLTRPVKRFLSNREDYFTWTVTFLPIFTGYLAARHLVPPYTFMLGLHILSVELLLVVLPFTKLFHAFTAFGSRYFNGDTNAHKGVPV